jgi:hypothetical protein
MSLFQCHSYSLYFRLLVLCSAFNRRSVLDSSCSLEHKQRPFCPYQSVSPQTRRAHRCAHSRMIKIAPHQHKVLLRPRQQMNLLPSMKTSILDIAVGWWSSGALIGPPRWSEPKTIKKYVYKFRVKQTNHGQSELYIKPSLMSHHVHNAQTSCV